MPEPSKLDLSPIRLPAWAVTLIVIVAAPLVTAFLTNTDWKPVAVGCISGLLPMLAVSEVARTKVVPVVSHDAQVQDLKAVGYAAAVDAKLEGLDEGRSAGYTEGIGVGRESTLNAVNELAAAAPKPAPAKKAATKKRPPRKRS